MWRVLLACRLEQLDRIAVGIVELDLLPARSDLHLVAEAQSRALQRLDARRQVGDSEHHAVEAAWLLALAVRHGARARCPRTAEQDSSAVQRDAGEGGQLLMLQLEAEVLGVEAD